VEEEAESEEAIIQRVLEESRREARAAGVELSDDEEFAADAAPLDLDERDAEIASDDDEDLKRALELSRREADFASGSAAAPVSCKMCTFDNPAGASECEVCGAPLS
jgi:hypothetical protein